MPAWYRINKARRLVESFGSGVFKKDDVDAHQLQLLNDPDFESDFSQIMDLTQVTGFEVTEAEIRYLAERNVFSLGSRRAIIVNNSEAYGLARMFEIIRALRGETGIRVVRSHDEAEEWLLAPEPAETHR